MTRLLKIAAVLGFSLVLATYGYSQAAANTAAPSTSSPSAAKEANLDSYIEVLRSDVQAKKVQIITEGMNFSDKESAVFWPIYRDYEHDLSKLNDQKIALIKEYAANYNSMSSDRAEEMSKKWFDLQDEATHLKREYFKRFEKVLPANRVAKFFQIDNRLDLLMNVQIASELPIIK